MKYRVMVDDNFHYMDESERYCAGEFSSGEEALREAKKILTDSLRSMREGAKNPSDPKEIYERYIFFGEDPFIVGGDEKVNFSAWTYAKEKAPEICREPI